MTDRSTVKRGAKRGGEFSRKFRPNIFPASLPFSKQGDNDVRHVGLSDRDAVGLTASLRAGSDLPHTTRPLADRLLKVPPDEVFPSRPRRCRKQGDGVFYRPVAALSTRYIIDRVPWVGC